MTGLESWMANHGAAAVSSVRVEAPARGRREAQEREKKEDRKWKKGEKKMGKFPRRKIKVNLWSWSKIFFCKKT
jgi:hypothetical protein